MRCAWLLPALLLAGCNDAADLPQELDVLRASDGGEAPWDGRSLGYARDVDCSVGVVHRVQVAAPGLHGTDAQQERWRLVWGDGHRTGVMYADVLQTEPTQVNLGGCPPVADQRVFSVELVNADGSRIGRAGVDR